MSDFPELSISVSYDYGVEVLISIEHSPEEELSVLLPKLLPSSMEGHPGPKEECQRKAQKDL